jgi:ankyrin repeat protein
LHLALIQKHYKVAMILGEHGANPSLVNMEGKDSLFYAPKNVQQSLQESTKLGPWNFVP